MENVHAADTPQGIYAPVAVILALFLRSLKRMLLFISPRQSLLIFMLEDGAPPVSGISGCYPISDSKILIVEYILLIVNETSLFHLLISSVRHIDEKSSPYDSYPLRWLQTISPLSQPACSHSVSGWNVLLRLHFP